jgi:erythromycin esterase-like protein
VRKKHLHCAVLVIALACICLPAYAHSDSLQAEDEDALAAATGGLCHSQIAMLGESATHGDGHALAFKVALVERLVDQCGFDSVFFEASHYEFIHLNRRLRMGQAVTSGGVLSAVGGLWRFNQEFQPLPSFLLAKAHVGKVFLGGIDDQLGQIGQDYANIEMVTELTNLLPQQERQACSVALHKRIYSDYTDASPYSKADRAQIETCLSEMQRANAADKTTDHQGKAERQEMISAAQRWVSRDFSSDAESIVNRDHSMFQNFQWLLEQKPTRHKVIIWAGTVHIAKLGGPTWGDRTGSNFGSFVHQKYGGRAFSLGFSALTGSFKEVGRQGIQAMPVAPPDSVEVQEISGNRAGAIYVGPAQLATIGTAPGAFFRHSFQTLSWSTFLDGVVVFREEHPPSRASEK